MDGAIKVAAWGIPLGNAYTSVRSVSRMCPSTAILAYVQNYACRCKSISGSARTSRMHRCRLAYNGLHTACTIIIMRTYNYFVAKGGFSENL